jgi:hypothetical protein
MKVHPQWFAQDGHRRTDHHLFNLLFGFLDVPGVYLDQNGIVYRGVQLEARRAERAHGHAQHLTGRRLNPPVA